MLNEAGQLQQDRSGTLLLLVSDERAQIAEAFGAPVSGGQVFTIPLTAGKAATTIVFASPGLHRVQATLQDDATLAGESVSLLVQDVFFATESAAKYLRRRLCWEPVMAMLQPLLLWSNATSDTLRVMYLLYFSLTSGTLNA